MEFWQLNPRSHSADWDGIIKANVMARPLMRTTLTILRPGILFYAMRCPGILLMCAFNVFYIL